MEDKKQIMAVYERMYRGMIHKDERILCDVLDDTFVLVHMTGMHQSKEAFIKAVLNGTLNYHSAVHEHMHVTLKGEMATLIGQSYVEADVFGGSKAFWHLQLACHMKKADEGWKITRSIASTY